MNTKLNKKYWDVLAAIGGAEMSARVGGSGKDCHPDLKVLLSDLFKEWDKHWKATGQKPTRTRKKKDDA